MAILIALTAGCGGGGDKPTLTASNSNGQVKATMTTCEVASTSGGPHHRANMSITNESEKGVVVHPTVDWKDGSHADEHDEAGVTVTGRSGDVPGATAWVLTSDSEVEGPDRVEVCGDVIRTFLIKVTDVRDP